MGTDTNKWLKLFSALASIVLLVGAAALLMMRMPVISDTTVPVHDAVITDLKPGRYVARYEMGILNGPDPKAVVIGKIHQGSIVAIDAVEVVKDSVYGEMNEAGSGIWVELQTDNIPHFTAAAG